MVMDLGWVDFDLGVPSSCPSAQPLLPNSHQTRQKWAGSGTNSSQPNPVHGQMNNPLCDALLLRLQMLPRGRNGRPGVIAL